MNRLAILALALATANAARLNKRQDSDTELDSELDGYLSEVCEPADQNGIRDWSAPCNAVISIQYECMYGTAGGEYVRAPPSASDAQNEDDNDGLSELPDETQRVCFCQSQFRDQIAGCMKCHKDHGGAEGSDWFRQDLIDVATKEYCDASKPANESFSDFFLDHISADNGTATESSSAQTSTFSDPIGNKTDVSLYFTASVTGTPAYIPALPATASSGANITYTTSMTSEGQIVPTLVDGQREQSTRGSQSSGSSKSGAAAATASSDAGAMQTAMAHSGAFGALGLAALIAAL